MDEQSHQCEMARSKWNETMHLRLSYFIGIQIFARSCFFFTSFFLNSFLYSLTYFLFFHQNQVIDFDWGGWNTVAIYLDLFLCAWLSLDDLHSVDLLQLSPWRGHPVDGHVSIINGAFIIKSCTLWCRRWRTASSAAANPQACPPEKTPQDFDIYM